MTHLDNMAMQNVVRLPTSLLLSVSWSVCLSACMSGLLSLGVWNVSIAVGGESSSWLWRVSRTGEEEGGGGGDDDWRLWPPPQHRGCLSLLSLSSLSLLSLSRTSDASSPLLVSLSLVSLCENCRVLSVCSGVWCGLVQRFRKRLTGELDITHPETLVWR